jgi:pimeloyl-ACP methyl ester carboxylesterase
MKKELVFLHGWGRDKKDWDQVIKCFGQEYNITALDLPGFGEETNVESFWGIPEYAKRG